MSPTTKLITRISDEPARIARASRRGRADGRCSGVVLARGVDRSSARWWVSWQRSRSFWGKPLCQETLERPVRKQPLIRATHQRVPVAEYGRAPSSLGRVPMFQDHASPSKDDSALVQAFLRPPELPSLHALERSPTQWCSLPRQRRSPHRKSPCPHPVSGARLGAATDHPCHPSRHAPRRIWWGRSGPAVFTRHALAGMRRTPR